MKEFEQNWNFPNCTGALDGKHVVIEKPAKPGSLCINYKILSSLIPLVVGDSNYHCMYTYFGAPGSQEDAGAWQTQPLQARCNSHKESRMPKEVKVARGPNILLPPVFITNKV